MPCWKGSASVPSPPCSTSATPASPSRPSDSPSPPSACSWRSTPPESSGSPHKLRLGIVAATGGICLFYVIEMVLGFFGIHFVAINGSGPIGIAFSLFVVAIAALNLVLDFDIIEQGVANGSPKYMEWYGAFGILVTLVWLYLEMIRLLSKLRSRN